MVPQSGVCETTVRSLALGSVGKEKGWSLMPQSEEI